MDALTPKQARLMGSLAAKLHQAGHEVLVTTRDYDFTPRIAEKYGVPHRVVGGYGGATPRSKLEADVERMRLLAEILAEFEPEVLVSYPSPSAVRVAYGLGLRIIIFSDSPHSVHPHRLTVPLADYLVHSSLIPSQLFDPYTTMHVKRVVFDGVEEWEWVEGHRCNPNVLEELGLEEHRYVVLRLPEYKAAYYSGLTPPSPTQMIDVFIKAGYNVVVMPRYEDQYLELKSRYGGDERVRILYREPLEALDLYCWAYGVVTGGATMAREAALLCRPAVNLYPVYINEVLERLGFPLRQVSVDVEPMALPRILDELRGRCPRSILERFEKPSKVLLALLESLH